MITYNHENFIREAIEGVLMQECDFEIELIVANDCSTDKTDEVIKGLLQNHPRSHRIKYINHIENKGMMPNFVWALQECKGNYIALCEGDDYWTDPLKLQKQVDFLDANPDYNICFHRVKIFKEEENKFIEDTITREVPETTKIEDLARGNFMHTPSVVFRNNFTVPDWFSKSPIGDWTLDMIIAKDKKIKKLDDVMAVYRVHKASIWALKSAEYRILNTIKSIKLLINSKEINPEVKKILQLQKYELRNRFPKKLNSLVYTINKIKRFFKWINH